MSDRCLTYAKPNADSGYTWFEGSDNGDYARADDQPGCFYDDNKVATFNSLLTSAACKSNQFPINISAGTPMPLY